MKYFSRLLATFFSLIIFCLSFSSAHAIYFGSGNNLDLPKDKPINETVMVSGTSIISDAPITGDLFCAGKDIIINGDIKGDVLCAGQNIKVNGNIDGNVRVVGQSVEINGVVNRNVMVAAQSLTLTKFSSVKGDIIFGVQTVDLRGLMGRDMLGGGQKITISGSLIRNAKITAENLSLVDTSKIGGNLEYFIDKDGTASVSPKNVKGEIIRHEVNLVPEKKTQQQTVKAFSISSKIFGAISYLILGLALIYFLSRGVKERTEIIIKKPVISGLVGLAALILTPVLFIVLMITIIGIPLAFVLMLEYILSMITASLYPTIILGQWLLGMIAKQKAPKVGWSLLVGIVAMAVLLLIPVIGGLTAFVSLCLGLGSIFISYLPVKEK